MERRSPRIVQKHELSCMWGLYSIIESCQGRTNRKLISNGRPVNKHIVDCPNKLVQFASFDEECRRIQNEADLVSVTADASPRNVEGMAFEKQKSKQNTLNGHRHAKIDSELVDILVKTHKRAKENSLKAYQTSSSRLQTTSAEISLNELTLAAILRTVSAQINQEESIHARAKAFVDQMFVDRKSICKDGTNTKSKYSNKDLFNETPGSTIAAEKGKMNENLWRKSVKTSFVPRPSDKIVILKPTPRNAKHSENVTCHCSSLQSRKKLSRRAPETKSASFSLKEMKKKLKHTFGVTRKEASQLKLCNERDLKSSRGSDMACVTDTGREKLDLSSASISNKQEFDVILEAKKHLSARFKNVNTEETVTSKKSVKTLGRILSSPEHDFWPISPTRETRESSSKISSGRESACLKSPLRPITEATSCDDYNKKGAIIHIMDTKTASLGRSTDEEADDMKSNGESKIVEMDNIIMRPQIHTSEVPSGINSNDVTRTMQITDIIESEKDGGTDSLSENEAFTSTVDDSPSTPLCIDQLDSSDSNKYQEEHQSPVSVLEPFFIEESNSPQSVTFQTDRQKLKPLCLDFEESSFESFPPISENSCIQEQNHLSRYVYLILEASCVNWDHLSEITSPHEEPIDSYIFDELEFLPHDCYFDPKLLFDHINEALLEIWQYHCFSPPWLAFVKPKTEHASLEELVLDEIMTKADFYLHSRTEKRTLHQLVSKDVADCRSWLDVRLDTEQIVIEVSEDFLDECIVDMLLEFYT